MELLIPVVIGAIASFIAWIVPAELFIPRISAKRYSEDKETVVNKTQDGEEIINYYTRKILVKNKSFLFAGYNISYSFEFYNSDNNIVYSESWNYSHLKRRGSRVLPLKAIRVDELEAKKIVGFSLAVICENRYGTKKKSNPYTIQDYTISRMVYSLND